jgi:hypothetical protein
MGKHGIFVSHRTVLIQEAVENLVEAASALREPTTKGLGTALMYTAMALTKIVRIDADEAGRKFAVEVIRRVSRET